MINPPDPLTDHGLVQEKNRSDFSPGPRAQRADRRARNPDQATRFANPANSGPKLRSTTLPPGAAIPQAGEAPSASRPAREPVFEKVSQEPLPPPAAPPPPELINEFGGRKFDLPAWWNRWCDYLRGPVTSNPRLVSYLAAGGVQGLSPMRYEKRVRRKRFFGLAAVLLVILFLMLWQYYRNH